MPKRGSLKVLSIFCSIIILLSMSVFAVSPPSLSQPSIENNQIRVSWISQDDNIPYFVNVRADQNFGELGGYFWAKTYNKQLYIDLNYLPRSANKIFISVAAIDGNRQVWGNSQSIDFQQSALLAGVDVIPPSINIIFPKTGDVFMTDEIEVRVVAFDSSGIEKVQINYRNTEWKDTTLTQDLNGNDYWGKIITLQEGPFYRINARAYDKAGAPPNTTYVLVKYHVPITKNCTAECENGDGKTAAITETAPGEFPSCPVSGCELCNSGYHLENDACLINHCAGKPIISHASFGVGTTSLNDHVTSNYQLWGYQSTGTLRACKWRCNSGYHQDGTSYNCLPDTLNCGGTAPTTIIGTTFGLPSYLTGHTGDTSWRNIDSGTPGNCQWICDPGYHQDGTSCVINECAQKPTIEYAEFGPDKSTTISNSQQWAYPSDGTIGACEWRCEPGYSRVENTNSCAANSCTGTEPNGANAIIGKTTTTEGHPILLSSGWQYDLSATLTTPCRWKCQDTFTQDGISCLDKQDPRSFIDFPSSTETLSSSRIWVEGHATDNDKVTKVVLRYNNQEWDLADDLHPPDGDKSVTWNKEITIDLSSTSHSLRATAFDSTGNSVTTSVQVGSCASPTPCGCGDTGTTNCAGECIGASNPPETCDRVDNDCDGSIDEGSNGNALTQSCYTGPVNTRDIGECKSGVQTCSNGNWGSCIGETLPVTESCEDETSGIAYDRLDNNCDGTADPDCESYCDEDGDDYPDHVVCLLGCWFNSWECSLDCDPTNAAVHPNAEDICDGIKNDCDDEIDEDGNSYCQNLHGGDGFEYICNEYGRCGFANGENCDPNRPYKCASENCGQVRDNEWRCCDSSCENYCGSEGIGCSDCPVNVQDCCEGGAPLNDCGTCGEISPEIAQCDLVDNDCDGTTDEGCTCSDLDPLKPCLDPNNPVYPNCVSEPTWYEDTDGDGYYASTLTQCDKPANGWEKEGTSKGVILASTGGGDCFDSNDDPDCPSPNEADFCDDNPERYSNCAICINPGVQEQCDGINNNCDDEIDEGCVDLICLRADLITNGKIDIFDVLELLKILDDPFRSADVDNNGVTDINDLLALLTLLKTDTCITFNECGNIDFSINQEAQEICYNTYNYCDGVVDVGCVDPATCERAKLDGDADVDIFDLLELLKILKDPSRSADVNNDGKTDIFDLLKMLNILNQQSSDPTLCK